MKIGELSRRTGVSIRMLRYYEAEGLLAPHRAASGYRDYGPEDERTVARIKLLGAAGMTLATIRQFLPCVRVDGPVFEPCDELRSVLNEQISVVDQKMGKLAQSRDVLSKFLRDIEAPSH
jgi:DNA-binding transcriptional MerR regulator